MQASPAAIAIIKEFEGLSLKPYRCAAGVWTVGYGSTGNASALAEMGLELTLEQAEALLAKEVGSVVAFLNGALAGIKVSQGQFDALVSLTFNIGNAAFGKSTLLRKLKLGDQSAADEFDRWVHTNGRRLEGLVRRRVVEKTLFLGQK